MVHVCRKCGFQEVIRDERPRTTGPFSQSHHFNGHVQAIAAETGHEFDEVKVQVKARAVKRGFPLPIEVVIDGERYAAFKSESQCSTMECAALIEEAHALAAELNIVLREGA